jgi:serine/threonine protein kinase, bacterial
VPQVASVSVTVEQALGSRYVLEERISSGGMGEIWRGRDLTAGRPVAVKLLHKRLASDPAELTRFVRERTVLTGLDHPNLVPVRDMIMEGSRLALIMDLVEGPDLHHYLRAHGPLAPALAAMLISQTCEALAVVHAAGIVHRDLKPSNILLDSSQSPPIARLTDFGIARTEDALPLTADHVIIGTPQYCAPEVINGERGGPAADVYAAGTTLYELLAGKPPFAGGPAPTVFWLHLDAEPLRPPGIPAPLWALIATCLAKDPLRRPTAEAVARSLRECLPALRDALPATPLAPGTLRFKLPSRTADEKEKPRVLPHRFAAESVGSPAPATRDHPVRLAAIEPELASRGRPPAMRLALPVSLMAAAGIAAAVWLASERGYATSPLPPASPASSTIAVKLPALPTLPSAPPGTAVRISPIRPTSSATHQTSAPSVGPSPASPTPTPQAPDTPQASDPPAYGGPANWGQRGNCPCDSDPGGWSWPPGQGGSPP